MNSSFQSLIDFFDATFFDTIIVTETHSGYESQRVSTGTSWQIIQLPTADTVTYEQRELNIPACLGAAVVMITFITLIRTFFRAIFGR